MTPDYRRARYSEVPQSIRRLCVDFLKQPMGSEHGPFVVGEQSFMIRLETHHDAFRGDHKGASVWIKK